MDRHTGRQTDRQTATTKTLPIPLRERQQQRQEVYFEKYA